MTPFTCWNTPCTPQKQPPARTIVSLPDDFAKGSSTAGAGVACALSAEERVVAKAAKARAAAPRPAKLNLVRFMDRLRAGGITVALSVRFSPRHCYTRAGPRAAAVKAASSACRRADPPQIQTTQLTAKTPISPELRRSGDVNSSGHRPGLSATKAAWIVLPAGTMKTSRQ